MEHGTAVTRTLSSGAIGSGARIGGKPDAAYDFSTERRHSSSGLRALLWATGSARSLGSFSCLESHSSKDNVHANILTPGSVPRFTIPSLSVRSVSLQPEDGGGGGGGGGTPGDGGEGDTTDEGLGLESTMCSLSVSPSSLSSRSFSGSSDPGRPAHRSVSDPLAVGRRAAVRRESSVPYLEDRHCPDPASRAALSLPHLEKVTTPYGFVTLSRSPQMASEEALLCVRRPQAWEESQERPPGGGSTPRAIHASSSTSCAPANPRPPLASTSRTPAPANPRPPLASTSRTPAPANPRPPLASTFRTPAPAPANPRPPLASTFRTPAPAPANPRTTSRRTFHKPQPSKDATSSHAAEVPKKRRLSRSAATAWSLTSASSCSFSEGKPTRRLWGVLRKHFTSQ